jgi:hypothetical protein
MELQCSFCDVGREFLPIIRMNFGLRRVNEAKHHEVYLTHLLLGQRLEGNRGRSGWYDHPLRSAGVWFKWHLDWRIKIFWSKIMICWVMIPCSLLGEYGTMLGVLHHFWPPVVRVIPLKTPVWLVISLFTIFTFTRNYNHSKLFLTLLRVYTIIILTLQYFIFS